MPIAPWGGIGTEGEWTDVRQCLFDCDLDFVVKAEPLENSYGTKATDVVAMTRCDTGDILGVTSPRYGITQNYEAFAPAQLILDATFGKVVNAGVTATNMVFLVMELSQFAVNGDEFKLYAIACNSFNGKYALATILSPVRLFCQNQFSGLIRGGSDRLISIKHNAQANSRLLAASAVIENVRYTEGLFIDIMRNGIARELDPYTEGQFYDKLLPMPERDKFDKQCRYEARIEYVKEARANWKQDYFRSETNEQYRGTKFGLLNAYYDYLSHGDALRKTSNWDDKRFCELTTGRSVNQDIIRLLI